jgi:hypothetical protein
MHRTLPPPYFSIVSAFIGNKAAKPLKHLVALVIETAWRFQKVIKQDRCWEFLPLKYFLQRIAFV